MIDLDGCIACDLTHGRRDLPGGLIHETPHWRVEHCIGPLGVGTLVVKPLRHVERVLALPSATTLYHTEMDLRRCLVVGISQSGETPDVAETVADARARGALTVAVTNNAASPLATASAWTLPTNAGTERAVAATKTYTAQLTVLALLWATWANDQRMLASLRREVPSAMARGLEGEVPLTDIASQLVDAPKLLVVARGFNLATALETSLKIQETAGLSALAYSGADLMHDPIAMLDPDIPVLCFAPSGKTQASMLEVITTLRGRGARILLVAPRQAAAALDLPQAAGTYASGTSRHPHQVAWIPMVDVPEPVSPIVAIVPGQLLACNLAVGRGRDPDHPKGLTKVTHTR